MSAAEETVEQVGLSPAQRGVLAALVLASALMAIDITIVSVALPQLSDLPGADLARLQWVVVGYALAFGALIQPAGSLSDRIGARPMFLGGMVVFVLASLACGLAPNAATLLGFRILKGMAAAAMFANVMPLLAKNFEGPARAAAVGLWMGTLSVTATVAPLLGGLLIDLASWRWMFFVNVPVGIVAIVLGARLIAEPTRETAAGSGPGTRFDLVGAVLFAGGVTTLSYALTRAQQTGWGDPVVLGLVVATPVLGVLFVLRERAAAAPVLDLALLRVPAFSGVLALAVINRIGTAGGTVFFMLYVQIAHGLSAFQTGVLLVPLGAVTVVASIRAGKLQASVPAWRVLAIGYALLAVAAVAVALQLYAGHGAWWLLPALMVWGLGNGLANAPLMVVATASAPIEKVGMATGLVNSFFPLGASLGIVGLGVVFAGLGAGPTAAPEVIGRAAGTVYLVVAAACLLGVLVAATLVRRPTPA